MGVRRILVIGPEPMFTSTVNDCLFRAFQYDKSIDACGAPRAMVERYQGKIITAISSATAGRSSVRFIDAVAALCGDAVCPAATEGRRSLSIDGPHMSRAGERAILDASKTDFEWVFGGGSTDNPPSNPPRSAHAN